MYKKLFLTGLATSLMAYSSASAASLVTFDFRTNQGTGGVFGADPAGTDFDPSGAGDTVSVGGLTATIIDITAPEYDVSGEIPMLTDNFLSAAAGDNLLTNVSSADALGINNSSISNNQFDALGDGNESSDFNPGESFTFVFDQDVIFTAIELESVMAVDMFDVLVDGTALLETIGDDEFIDDLGSLGTTTIFAGTEITFAVDGVLSDIGPSTSLRIETFTVEVIPEPSSLALIGIGGLMLAQRRKRS